MGTERGTVRVVCKLDIDTLPATREECKMALKKKE